MQKLVDVIAVAHNSSAALKSLLITVPVQASALVIDNASTDNSVSVAERLGARVISVGKNIGYGAACNLGAASGTAPFLLFVNPDIRLTKGAIEAFLEAAALHPKAAFNPRFFSGGRRRFKKRSRLLAKTEYWIGKPPETDCAVPTLHGACVFIRREHFDIVSGFDPDIFLYHEDDDLSLRLRQADIELRLAADAAVDHAEGRSSIRSQEIGYLKGEAMGRSLVYVMKKHGRVLNVSAERWRAGLKLALPYVLFNDARRAKNVGFWRGLSATPKRQ